MLESNSKRRKIKTMEKNDTKESTHVTIDSSTVNNPLQAMHKISSSYDIGSLSIEGQRFTSGEAKVPQSFVPAKAKLRNREKIQSLWLQNTKRNSSQIK